MSIIISESTPVLPTKRDQTKGYSHEFKWLFKNAIPLVISYLLQNSLQSVSIISAGHLVSNENFLILIVVLILLIFLRAPMNYPQLH